MRQKILKNGHAYVYEKSKIEILTIFNLYETIALGFY